MSLISAFLMIVHNNVPFLFSYLYMWGPIFVISVLVFYPKYLSNRLFLLNAFLFLLYALILPKILWTELNDWYSFRQITNFSTITVAVALFIWLRDDHNPHVWSKLAITGLFFIIITCLMTIIATRINPLIVRASYSSVREDITNFLFFRRLGIGSYGFITAITLLFPPLIYLYKKEKNQQKNHRMIFGAMVIIYITLIQAQVLANILIATIIIILSTLINPKKTNKKLLRISYLLIFILVIPNFFWGDFLGSIAELFNSSSILHEKFSDISSFVYDPQSDNSETEIAVRIERYPMLWEAFTASPLFGDASYNSSFEIAIQAGGHLFWMSRLALWGILGFGFFIWFLYKNFKAILRFSDHEFRYYHLLSILSFVALGLIKNVNFIESFLVLYVIIPGLYLTTFRNKTIKPIHR